MVAAPQIETPKACYILAKGNILESEPYPISKALKVRDIRNPYAFIQGLIQKIGSTPILTDPMVPDSVSV